MEHRPSPIVSPGYLVRLLLAEADRLAGYPTAGGATLRRGLAVGLTRSDYGSSLPGVVGAALLAADLGDRSAAAELAAGWQQVRQRLGLPAPLGYADQVATVLGLSPEPPGTAEGIGDDPALPELLQQAHDWAAAT